MERHEPPHGGSGAVPRPDTDDAPPDPREGLAIVAAQRRRVRDSDVDPRVLFGAWGLGWLLAYGMLWWDSSGSPTGTATARGGIAFGAILLVALVVTLVHVARAGRGLAGASQRTGAMYGSAWGIGFAGQGLIVGGIVNAGANPAVIAIVANSVACLVVGMMYMAGGALWRETAMYVIGAWMIAVAAAASLVGMPAGYLVMSLAGGGGMLVGAAISAVYRRRA